MNRVAPREPPDLLVDLATDALRLLTPVFVIVAVFTIVTIVVARRTVKGSNVQGGYALMVAFGVLGCVAGLITGNSREPIAGPLLTGLLGVITALLSYLFSQEALRTYRPYIPFLIIALVVNAVAGLSIGAAYRKRFEIAAEDRHLQLLLFEKVQLELWKEEEKLKLYQEYPAAAERKRAAEKN